MKISHQKNLVGQILKLYSHYNFKTSVTNIPEEISFLLIDVFWLH